MTPLRPDDNTQEMPDPVPRAGGKDVVTEFARSLLLYRRAAGLTQEELAERPGLSVPTISDMERGRARGPQRRSVATLADGLGLTRDEAVRFQAAAHAGRSRFRSDVDSPAPAVRLCELPPEPGELIGRDTEFAWPRRFATGNTTDSPHRTVATITGPPRVGKTTLAVRAGDRQVRAAFDAYQQLSPMAELAAGRRQRLAAARQGSGSDA